MKRRGFLKGLLMIATTPVAAKLLIEDSKPMVVGVDLAKQTADHTVVSAWGVDSWNPHNFEGGYMYSDDLSKKIREAMKPMVKFRSFS